MEYVFALDRSWTDKNLTAYIAKLEREKRHIRELPRLLRQAIKQYRKWRTKEIMGLISSDSWQVGEAKQKIQYLQEQQKRKEQKLRELQEEIAPYRIEHNARQAIHALRDAKKRKRTTPERAKKAKWLEVAPDLFLLRSLRDQYLKLSPPCSITIEQGRYVIHHQTGYAKFVLTTTLPRGEDAEPFTQLPLAA